MPKTKHGYFWHRPELSEYNHELNDDATGCRYCSKPWPFSAIDECPNDKPKPPPAPAGSMFCRWGHEKEIQASQGGRPVCIVCANRRNRAVYRRKIHRRRRRLKDLA